MVTERKSVKTSLVDGLNNAKQVIELSGEISEAVAELAKKRQVDLGRTTLALALTTYSMVKFGFPVWEVERRWMDTMQLAKEIYEATKKKEQETDETSP